MLSEPELRDMLLTGADVDAEAGKLFWQRLDLSARG